MMRIPRVIRRESAPLEPDSHHVIVKPPPPPKPPQQPVDLILLLWRQARQAGEVAKAGALMRELAVRPRLSEELHQRGD